MRALPLWAKIVTGATIFTVIAGGMIGPAVYFTLPSELFSF